MKKTTITNKQNDVKKPTVKKPVAKKTNQIESTVKKPVVKKTSSVKPKLNNSIKDTTKPTVEPKELVIDQLSDADVFSKEFGFSTSKDFDAIKATIYKLQKPMIKIEKTIHSIKKDIAAIKEEIELSNQVDELQTKYNAQEEKLNSLSIELKEIKDKEKKSLLKFNFNKEKQVFYKLKAQYFNAKTFNLEKANILIEKYEKQIQSLKDKIAPLEIKLKPHVDKLNQIIEKNNSLKSKHSFVVKNLNTFYGTKQSLYDINLELPKKSVIAIIGPSGCGKSTFLKTLNRINDEFTSFKASGEILLDGIYDIYKLHNIYNVEDKMSITELRTKVGMIFQQPNPFPMSIWKNITYGPRINGIKLNSYLDEVVEGSLKKAALWEEVKNNLNMSGVALSGGQQQRLCIARAIANNPEVLLMDEPTSALDPIAASKIEELILELKKDFTIIMVTHSMQQAARISDYTAFFYQGRLIEYGPTKKIFTNPKEQKTDDYIRGRFG